jgi:hypothetical protein
MGNPIEGVRTRIKSTDENAISISSKTNAGGEVCSDLTRGTYTLQLEKEGFFSALYNWTIGGRIPF